MATAHAAVKYLKPALGSVLLDEWLAVFPVAKRTYPYLFCNYAGKACHNVLEYTGRKTMIDGKIRSYCFTCRNCKGHKKVQAQQLANNHNVDQGTDAEIWTPRGLIDLEDYRFAQILYLEIPKDPIYKSVDVAEGGKLFSRLVEITDSTERFLYWARGFSNHPDLNPPPLKKKRYA